MVPFSSPSRSTYTTACIWTNTEWQNHRMASVGVTLQDCQHILAFSHIYCFKTLNTEHLKLIFLVFHLIPAIVISLLQLDNDSQSSSNISHFDGSSSQHIGSQLSSLWCIYLKRSEEAKVLGGHRRMFVILSVAKIRHYKSECSQKQDKVFFSNNRIIKLDIPAENRTGRGQGVWISLLVYWHF